MADQGCPSPPMALKDDAWGDWFGTPRHFHLRRSRLTIKKITKFRFKKGWDRTGPESANSEFGSFRDATIMHFWANIGLLMSVLYAGAFRPSHRLRDSLRIGLSDVFRRAPAAGAPWFFGFRPWTEPVHAIQNCPQIALAQLQAGEYNLYIYIFICLFIYLVI